MRPLVVTPGQADSARLDDVAEPPAEDGPVLVEALAVGVCGTDLEIVAGQYGWAPPGPGPADPRATSRSAGCSRRPAAPAWRRATWSSASSAGPTRCRARTAPSASGTCAATAGTPSAASSSATAIASERYRIEPGVRGQGRPGARPRSACCWSRRACWPRRGSTSSGSAGRRALGAADGSGHRGRADRPARRR